MVVFYRGYQQDTAFESSVDLDQQFSALGIHANASALGSRESRDVLLYVASSGIIITSLWPEAEVQSSVDADYLMKNLFSLNLFFSENKGTNMSVSDYFCLWNLI